MDKKKRSGKGCAKGKKKGKKKETTQHDPLKGLSETAKKDILERALQDLDEQTKSDEFDPEELCDTDIVANIKCDDQVKLYCQGENNIVDKMRIAILHHKWSDLASLLSLVCELRSREIDTIAMRACIILLLNHPKSSINVFKKFIQSCTGYSSDADIEKYIKLLLSSTRNTLDEPKQGKYVRSSWKYRIVDDVTFADI